MDTRNWRLRPSARQKTYPPAQQAAAPRNTAYERESGLVYNEVEVLGRTPNSNWIFDYKTPNIVKRKTPPNSETGARSLCEMALIKLGAEAQDLTVEALQSLPWEFGRQIWARVVQNHAESFYLWRTFATAYYHEFAAKEYRYMLDMKAPSLELAQYYRGLTSPKCDWLTCLRISPKQISITDLVAISSITNLTVLDLSDGQLYIENRESTLDTRVMRSWSELAGARRAFRHLQVLMLGWQEKIDTWMFDYLDFFPRLNTVILTDCRRVHHKNHKDWEEYAWKHGWQFMPSKRGAKHLRPLLDNRSFYVASISNLHYESNHTSHTTVDSVKTGEDRPLLECWLGSPRPWTHIIDEFPGTRTVFFYKEPADSEAMRPRKAGINGVPSGKREPSSPQHGNDAKRIQGTTASRRKAPKHSVTSLLAGMS